MEESRRRTRRRRRRSMRRSKRGKRGKQCMLGADIFLNIRGPAMIVTTSSFDFENHNCIVIIG